MNYSFHPAAEAEFLESVGYYESKVPGLGGAFIEEFEALATLVGESPKAWQVELQPDILEHPFTDFPCLSFTEKGLMAFRFWLFHMTGGVHSIGWAGFNNRLHSERFSAASLLQTGACCKRWATRSGALIRPKGVV
ncbi:MAG: hypothetical protein L0J77_08940 [Marinobacter sp.]|nr:hypothetical protein [Marinobacter sp.]